tara:strand:+ start:530 stop:694 length:165 start_codon:yes stop_codon:yes gene_type:complete
LSGGADLSLEIGCDGDVELKHPLSTNEKLLWMRKIAESLMEEGWDASGKNTGRD